MDYLDLIRFASFKPNWLSHSSTWVGHIPFAAWLMKSYQPKVFVELGTYAGNSYFSFCQAVEKNSLTTKCFAIDTWQGDEHGGFYGEDIYSSVKSYNEKNYNHFSTLIRSTFDEALEQFEDGSVHLLHIDGLHTYEAVKHDFESWLPKLSRSAVVIFHDTNIYDSDFGVHQFWKEIQSTYQFNLEFPHSSGLGVLWTGGDLPESLKWLDKGAFENEIIKNYFVGIGRGVRNKYLLDEKSAQFSEVSKFAEVKEQEVLSLNKLVWKKEDQAVTLNQLEQDRVVQVNTYEELVKEQEKTIEDLEVQISTLTNIVERTQGSLLCRIGHLLNSTFKGKR